MLAWMGLKWAIMQTPATISLSEGHMIDARKSEILQRYGLRGEIEPIKIVLSRVHPTAVIQHACVYPDGSTSPAFEGLQHLNGELEAAGFAPFLVES
jgi:hypothetical protein